VTKVRERSHKLKLPRRRGAVVVWVWESGAGMLQSKSGGCRIPNPGLGGRPDQRYDHPGNRFHVPPELSLRKDSGVIHRGLDSAVLDVGRFEPFKQAGKRFDFDRLEIRLATSYFLRA
jgi:hypothetical protein